MADVLILGGTVFAGRHMLHRLLGAGHRVTVLNRGRSLAPDRLPDGAVHVAADRSDPAQVRAALEGRRFEAVYDFSGYRPAEVGAVLDATAAVGRYVFISTLVVYSRLNEPDPAGRTRGHPVVLDEESPTVGPRFGDGDAVAHYAAFKRGCEAVLLEQNRVPATILRPCGIHGVGDRWYRHDYFFDRITAGRPVLVPDGHVGRTVHLTAVSGLVDAALAASDQGGHAVYNVADDEAVTCEELAGYCAAAAGTDTEVLDYPRALPAELFGADVRTRMPRGCFPFGDEPGFRLDTARVRGELGWAGSSLKQSTEKLLGSHSRRAAAGRLAEPDFRIDDAVLARRGRRVPAPIRPAETPANTVPER